MGVFELIFTILFCAFYLFQLNIIFFLSFLASFRIIYISFYFLPPLILEVIYCFSSVSEHLTAKSTGARTELIHFN